MLMEKNMVNYDIAVAGYASSAGYIDVSCIFVFISCIFLAEVVTLYVLASSSLRTFKPL